MAGQFPPVAPRARFRPRLAGWDNGYCPDILERQCGRANRPGKSPGAAPPPGPKTPLHWIQVAGAGAAPNFDTPSTDPRRLPADWWRAWLSNPRISVPGPWRNGPGRGSGA